MPSGMEVLPEVLAQDPVRCRAVFASLEGILGAAGGADLFSDSGLPTARSFLAEASDRLCRRLLPEPRADHDLVMLVGWLVRQSDFDDTLLSMDRQAFAALTHLVMSPDHPALWDAVRVAAVDGFRLLAARVLDIGLHPRLRNRKLGVRVVSVPAHCLFSASAAMADAWDAGLPGDQKAWLAAANDCQQALAATRVAHGSEGVSVEVVFSLDVLERCLHRMRLIANLFADDPVVQDAGRYRLVRDLVVAVRQDRSLRDLARHSMHLLHRRIVDRSGTTGEHYIALDRKEYRQIWGAAAGGGLLTTVTAVLKLAAHHACHVASVAPVVEGLAYGLNYSASFIVLQHTHLMLATKQPAMTAAALATIVRDRQGDERQQEIITYAQRICASQVAAVTANVLAVGLGGVVFDAVWHACRGAHFLSADDAQQVYTNFSPLHSLTLVYAVMTGVILWLSSLVGGFIDNWVAWHRLPRALEDHGWARSGAALRLHAAGWGTNISLGMMLGFMPVVGGILGLPLDVRHVTLSSGQFALAWAAQADGWQGGFVLLVIAGLAAMFVLNLSVSFLLSLLTSMQAYKLSSQETWRLLRQLLWSGVTEPWAFMRPPAKGTDS